MTEIKLKDGETGYEAVAGYIYRYWNHYRYIDSVLVKLAVSYNGEDWETLPIQIASPDGFRSDDILFDMDWWEGEKYIRLYGIKFSDFVEVEGGIYE